MYDFFFTLHGDHRDLHVLTHSFPTRRSSDLTPMGLITDATVRSLPARWKRDSIFASGVYLSAADLGIFRRSKSTRSEEHTSELQSLMRSSYAVFCLKQKKNIHYTHKSSYHRTTHDIVPTTHYHYQKSL